MHARHFISVPAVALLLAGSAHAQSLGGLFDQVVNEAKQKIKQKAMDAATRPDGTASSARDDDGSARRDAAQANAPAADDSTQTGIALPVPAPKLPMAAAASWGTAVVNADGSVTAWPDQADGQAVHVVLPRKAVDAAVHQYTAFILLDDGTVMGLGQNTYQSLGRDGANTDTPVPIPGLRDIVHVVATYGHALALRSDGAVFAWGEDVDGLRGDLQGSHAPVTRVPGLPAVVQVATAARHSLALGQDGRVYAWGNNGHGELGRGATGAPAAPVPVPGLDDVIAIAAGLQTSLALKRDGSVWAWGSNQSAMLGNGGRGGSASDGNAASPVPVTGVSGARQIVAGEGFALALLADGTVRAWGFDGYGEIGVGTAGGYHASPTRIPTLAKVVNLNAGGYRVFATTGDGRLWHWGTPIPVAPGHRPNVKVPVVLEP
ncbi:MAG: hypothetical protein WDN06_20125 [Asticcacaulis sp.]